MGKVIGINQRISVTLIENGLKAVFDCVYSKEFARSLAEYEFQGGNRLDKAVSELSKVVEKKAITPFLLERKEQVMKIMQYKADRAIIVAALYNSAFPFSYEVVCILGKYFHVQDQVSHKLLEKISEIYGFNKSISNAIDYSIPTLVEAGFIERPTAGIYTKPTLNTTTEIALTTYRESFFLNNPLLNRSNDYNGSPYFLNL